ncbi:MAG TPA: 2-oxo-4-hydroxy-4-carboxy-5-ureidoimidazoline decarboxylase [Thermoanaerobaculia bacterium]|nr:2-oxo-4-hydroxy-4-carboxy-5-ureidoimidazoline decarboxylase [Thermoanaerobaculia bacterium]
MSRLETLNSMPAADAARELLAACGSREWARRMAAARPFCSESDLLDAAERTWITLDREDWLEAFAAHPKIGGPASGQAAREQSGAAGASAETLHGLAAANREYEERFGRIFIVCASGKSAEEMLDLCRRRLHNDPREELAVAADEQRKITRLRLERWIGGESTVDRRQATGGKEGSVE